MTDLNMCREHFIQGVSRISHFWGFPKAMGAIYGAIYLSPVSLTLDDLVKTVGISKGAVSTNVRSLERLKIIHKQFKIGDRKDYYEAETDFWQIIKNVLREREKSEFDLAIRSVSESLEMVDSVKTGKKEKELAAHYKERMRDMHKFFNQLDGIVATVLALDELRIGVVTKMFGNLKGE